MFYLRVPASLGQLVFVSRKLMHSADIVYKNDPIIVVEITVDMKNVIIAIIYAPQTSVQKKKKKRFFQTRTNVIKALASEKDTTVLKGDELGDEPRM